MIVLKRYLLPIAILLALLAPVSKGQQPGGTTQVVGVVKDPLGNLYTNSQISFIFYDPGTSGKLPLLNGSTFQTTYTGYATDSFGNIPSGMYLPDNGLIAGSSGATGTQWIVKVCYSDRATCFTTNLTINCAGNQPATCTSGIIDISSVLQAAAAPLPATVFGNIISPSINRVLYVGAAFTNIDIGQQINNAYSLLPSTGGKIVLTPQALGQCYNYSTRIVLATQGKFAILEGGSGTSNSVGDVDGNSCLNYTPNTNTVAMTLGWGPVGGGGYSPGAGLRDITLKANGGCSAVGGCGNLATGVMTTNGGVPQGYFQNVKIEGFATGWNYNDNSDGWGVEWVQFHLVNNTLGLTVTSTLGEEKLFWNGGSCSVNGQCMNITPPATDLYLTGVSIDSNTTSPAIFNGGTIHCSLCHFENLSTLNSTGGANVQYITSGNAITLLGGLVLNDNVSATPAGQFFTTINGFFSMYGTAVYSPNQVMTNILNNTSAGSGNINVTTIAPSGTPNLCSVNQNCVGSIQIGSNPAVQIPVLKFPEGPSVTGLGNFTVCGANAVSHILECNYGTSGTYQMAQTIASSLIQTPAVLGTGVITSGACAAAVTITATGVNINDTLTWSPNGDTSTLTGYGANVAGHLDINAWPSANAVNFKVCNSTAGSLTPHSLQLNWAVVRW